LAGAISYVMGPDVTLVSSAEETALDVFRQLRGNDQLRAAAQPPNHVFAETATGPDRGSFSGLSRRFLGPLVTMTSTLPGVPARCPMSPIAVGAPRAREAPRRVP